MGALSADSSLVSAQAAFKIYLYHPLERLQFFIIIVPKWALSHAGPSPSILSPSRALSFLCHLPDYRELNREKGGGEWMGGKMDGWMELKFYWAGKKKFSFPMKSFHPQYRLEQLSSF